MSGKTAPFPDCVSFSMSLSLLCPPHCWETSPAAPGSPESHLTLQVSAATGLRGHGLGTPRLPQLAKGGITVLNAGAHPLGVQLTWEEGGERSGPAPGNLWALPSTPRPVSWGVSPESILFRMVRAHFRNASSTFSPVRALVSRNISSGGGRGTDTQDGQGLSQSPTSTQTLTCYLSFCPSSLHFGPPYNMFPCHECPLPQVPTGLFLQNSAPISSSRKPS